MNTIFKFLMISLLAVASTVGTFAEQDCDEAKRVVSGEREPGKETQAATAESPEATSEAGAQEN